MMKRKITIFLIAALLPALAWAAVTGLPSRPTFQKVTISQPSASDVPLTINGHSSASVTNLEVSAAGSGKFAGFRFMTAGSPRWNIRKSSGAETGSNAGSDLQIASFTDAGGVLGTPLVITRSTGDISITGALSSSRACAGGYVRVTPNFCKLIAAPSFTAMGAGCLTIAAPSAGVKVEVLISLNPVSANTAGAIRSAQVNSYTALACGTSYDSARHDVWEFVAVAPAATAIGQTYQRIRAVSDGGGSIYLQSLSGSNLYFISGYWD